MPRAEQGRGLRAVVFVDTVSSTQIAAALGDERWQNLLRRELQILRRLLKDRGGVEVDVAGDGLFALFREPAPAVRFAASAAEAVRDIGLEIRTGIHFGEVEFAEGRPAGIVVHTGARTMSLGGAGDVLVTQNVRDLLAGGHLGFDGHGTHELRGVPGAWSLFRLTEVDDKPVGVPLLEEDAGTRRDEASQPVLLVKRRTILVGAGAAAIAGGSLATFLLSRPHHSVANRIGPAPGSDRLFRYDATNEVLTMLPLVFGSAVPPCIAVGEGAVWTGDFYLYHVDPADGSVRDPIPLGRGNSDFIVDITTAFNDVWVVSTSGLHRIDAGDDQELRFQAAVAHGYDVATGFRSVWVPTDRGVIARIEPTRQLPVREIELPNAGVPSGVAVASDRVWVSDEFGALIPVDPLHDVAEEPVIVGGSPKGLTATSERLWVVDEEDRSVTVVDLDSRAELRSIPIEGAPVDVVAGLGAVWVADIEGSLLKIGEAELDVVAQVPVSGPVAALAIDEDAGVVWLRTTHT